MVKCAVFKCTSGYQPKKKEKEMIKRGEIPPCKNSVFRIPKNPEIRSKWVAAICRSDVGFDPDRAGVCQLHFKSEDFNNSIAPRTKTERLRLKLKVSAVPSVFNKYSVTARPRVVKERKTNLSLASTRRAEEDKTAEFFDEKLVDLDDLFSKLSNEVLPSGFRPVMMSLYDGSKVLSVRTETVDAVTGLPIILCTITVYEDLTYVMHTNDEHLSSNKVSDITSHSGKFTTLDEVVNVLVRVEGIPADTNDHLQQAASFLEAFMEQGMSESAVVIPQLMRSLSDLPSTSAAKKLCSMQPTNQESNSTENEDTVTVSDEILYAVPSISDSDNQFNIENVFIKVEEEDASTTEFDNNFSSSTIENSPSLATSTTRSSLHQSALHVQPLCATSDVIQPVPDSVIIENLKSSKQTELNNEELLYWKENLELQKDLCVAEQQAYGLTALIVKQNNQILCLSKLVTCLTKKINKTMSNVLKKCLSAVQIDILLNNPRRVQWDESDFEKALELYNISEKAYSLLLDEWQIPLPSIKDLLHSEVYVQYSENWHDQFNISGDSDPSFLMSDDQSNYTARSDGEEESFSDTNKTHTIKKLNIKNDKLADTLSEKSDACNIPLKRNRIRIRKPENKYYKKSISDASLKSPLEKRRKQKSRLLKNTSKINQNKMVGNTRQPEGMLFESTKFNDTSHKHLLRRKRNISNNSVNKHRTDEIPTSRARQSTERMSINQFIDEENLLAQTRPQNENAPKSEVRRNTKQITEELLQLSNTLEEDQDCLIHNKMQSENVKEIDKLETLSNTNYVVTSDDLKNSELHKPSIVLKHLPQVLSVDSNEVPNKESTKIPIVKMAEV